MQYLVTYKSLVDPLEHGMVPTALHSEEDNGEKETKKPTYGRYIRPVFGILRLHLFYWVRLGNSLLLFTDRN
jgi:hypothetical protein